MYGGALSPSLLRPSRGWIYVDSGRYLSFGNVAVFVAPLGPLRPTWHARQPETKNVALSLHVSPNSGSSGSSWEKLTKARRERRVLVHLPPYIQHLNEKLIFLKISSLFFLLLISARLLLGSGVAVAVLYANLLFIRFDSIILRCCTEII